MREYLDLLEDVYKRGENRLDRTGTGTRSLFGVQMRFDLRSGFPIETTRKMPFKSAIHELLWLLSGDTNIKYLEDNGVSWWRPWADENGNLGYVYGKILRDFEGKDQLIDLINGIKTDPFSRRHIMTMWHPARMHEARLPSCHGVFIQFYVGSDNTLSMHMVQRSGDMFLGVPTNIVMYSALLHMIAQVCDLQAKDFIHTISDAHIYTNHFNQVAEQIRRTPFSYPVLSLNPHIKNILDFKIEDFELINYKHHPAIKAEISV